MKLNVTDLPTAVDAAGQRVVQASSSLHNTIDKVADPLHTAVDAATFTAHHAVDSVAEGASKVAEKLSVQSQKLGEGSRRALDYGREYVREHPLQAVAGVFLAGLVIGRVSSALAHRRHSH